MIALYGFIGLWGFIVYLALTAVTGWIALEKGRSLAGFFFLSLLLSPLVGLIAVFGARTREPIPAKPLAPIRPWVWIALALTAVLVISANTVHDKIRSFVDSPTAGLIR